MFLHVSSKVFGKNRSDQVAADPGFNPAKILLPLLAPGSPKSTPAGHGKPHHREARGKIGEKRGVVTNQNGDWLGKMGSCHQQNQQKHIKMEIESRMHGLIQGNIDRKHQMRLSQRG